MEFPEVVAALRAAGCVYAEDEAALLCDEAALLCDEAGGPDRLRRWVTRRVAGEPLEVILGWAEFYGLRIAISPGVFVPRRRTEAIVDVAAGLVTPGAVMLDLCCGSGAVAAALGHRIPGLTVLASDIDPVAVACATRNLPGHSVFESDLFDAVPARWRGRLDVITANTPYVPTSALATMPPEARDHEPPVTLDGGGDGLDIQRRVAAEVGQWLRPGGSLIVETSAAQADTAVSVMTDAGLVARVVTDDERDATVVVGTAGQGPVRT